MKLSMDEQLIDINQALLTLVADNSDMIIFVKDMARRYVYINRLGREYLKIAADAQLGFCDEDILHSSCLKTISAHDDRVLALGEDLEQMESIQSLNDHVTHHFSVKKKAIINNHNVVIGIMGFATDVTDMQTHQLELQHMVMTDSLTGLVNRRYFMNALERECARSKRQAMPFVLCVLDVDNFKRINDIYGHAAGDKVLVVLSELLKSALRQEDTIARLGGEEFGLLLPNTKVLLASQLIKRLLAELRKFRIQISDSVDIGITVSVGITQWEDTDAHFESCLHKADQLMYEAKEHGKNRFRS
ncbi:MAG: GGDEF domain-containing protein [Shewanella sp.]